MKPDDGHESSHADAEKTVRDVLSTSSQLPAFLTRRGDIRIVVLCGDIPFNEGLLGGIPHITLCVQDDLLEKIRELEEENGKLRESSLIDDLTELGNTRFFWMQLKTELARTKRTGLPCTLMMMDLDNFKELNDTLGHVEGDSFLALFGKLLRENSRSTDLPCRYGGDEFGLIMPATSLSEALKSANRLRNLPTRIPQRSTLPVSLSIGIAEYTHYSSFDATEFVRAADSALYKAKRGGKNRIEIDEASGAALGADHEVGRDEKDALFQNYKDDSMSGE